MNKPILASFAILCLLSILFLIEYQTSAKASSTTWFVDDDGPADFNTIQEAVNNATSGDRIFVRVGIYYEHIVVNKSVSLVGEDRDSTIIDGNETGRVISITANNASIEGFTIKRSGTRLYDSGIFIDHCSGNNISHNMVTNNHDGISFYSSSNNIVSSNTITNNHDGISFYYSSNNIVSSNTITNNHDGISFYYSSNNIVSSNTITNNHYDGISFYSSSNNIVSSNTITNNNHGMYLAFDSSNNTIYCNNFNNTYQVSTDSANVWDHRNEGNYWSDYIGTDTDQDGIGDTPYEIAENNKDNYPLMGMFSDFPVSLEGEIYHVTTICNSTISEFRFEIGPETGNKILCVNVTDEDSTVGFCRVRIPTELMSSPYIVLVDAQEIVPPLLDVSNETYAYLYFTYIHGSHIITIISSKTLLLYNELLNKYTKLEIDLYNLNDLYQKLLNNYTDFLGNYSILLTNYSELQKSHQELNNSYQEFLFDYSKKVNNIQNLMYIFAATTAIFIITTIYLSKSAHASKAKVFEEARK